MSIKEYASVLLIVLFLSGCRIITDEEQKNFEREYKRHQEQQEEPYIPSP